MDNSNASTPGLCPTCVYALPKAERDIIAAKAQFMARIDAKPELRKKIEAMIVTTQDASNWPIASHLGIVSGECAYGMNLFLEFLNAIRDTFGGRSKSFQDLMKLSRYVAVEEMKIEAAALGADAVVAVDLDYSEVGSGKGSMMICVANGTAVKLQKPIGEQSNPVTAENQDQQLPPSLPS